MPDFEYAVRCPDGTVWDDRYNEPDEARHWAAYGDDKKFDGGCGCQQQPHTVVRRSLAWEEVPGDGR